MFQNVIGAKSGAKITIKIVFPHPKACVLFFMDSQEKINALRNIIDDFDDQILDLLVKRFSVSKEIGSIKTEYGLEIGDPNREREIIDRLSKNLDGKLNRDDISAIFSPIYQISKKMQIEES